MLRSAVTPAASSAAWTAGGVAAGDAQRAADEGRGRPAAVESREGGLPARRRSRRRPCGRRRCSASVPCGDDAAGGHETRRSQKPASSRWWVVTSTPAPPPAARVDGLPERRARAEVHARGGLVEDEQLGRVREGRREGETAAQPERQVAHERARARLEVGLQRRRGAPKARAEKPGSRPR